jgi:glutamine amidotransferase
MDLTGMSVVIADYGMGNIESIANMVRRVGGSPVISDDPHLIAQAGKLVLPGVGAFDKGISALAATGIKDAVYAAANQGSVILGICLGMQLLMDSSEEGALPGLGLVPGRVCLFPKGLGLKVPHMGWNHVYPTKDSLLFSRNSVETPRYYFVHSYYAKCAELNDVAATTHHGLEFASAFSRNNVLGVQFHPEKSHRFGMALIRRFLDSKYA